MEERGEQNNAGRYVPEDGQRSELIGRVAVRRSFLEVEVEANTAREVHEH